MMTGGLLIGAAAMARGAGYEFEGVGARQVSRGGAAIADANDWTAIYWNPGNIGKAARRSGRHAGLEIFGGEAFERDSNSLSSLPGLGPVFNKKEIHLNSLLGATGAIIPVGERFGIGFGFYTPLLQGSDFKDASPLGLTLDLENTAGILTWNVSGSYEVSPRVSVGAGLNLLYGRVTNDITIGNFPIPTNTLHNEMKADGFGLEGMLGVQCDVSPKVSLGAVFRSGSDVTLDGRATVDNSHPMVPSEASNLSYDLRHPPTIGVGSAFRPTPALTLTFDVNRTLWHRFKSNSVYDSPGTLLQNAPNSFDWDNTWKLRFGSMYKLADKTDLLAGYSYDEPALDLGSTDLATATDVYMSRFSLGVAHRWTQRFETILGIVGGSGERKGRGVKYRQSGYQVMLESSVGF